MKGFKIPEATVTRLSVYSRCLDLFEEKGEETVSSSDIAKQLGVTPAQVRKDLAYFGEFGTRGIGYNVNGLQKQILKILGLNKEWNVAIIGAGNLGSALFFYKGFKERGFKIAGIFDNDSRKIGRKIGDKTIIDTKYFAKYVIELKINLGIVAVPAVYAQETVDMVVKAGIKGIINFAPVSINIPDDVMLRRVDLAAQLELITFNINKEEQIHQN